MSRTLRIACGAGFWGDSSEAPRELVEKGELDYLVFDYLAEITMSLLARARAKDAALGYATDFPAVIAQLAPQLKARGIKVVSNAGGVNPQACRAALQEKLKAQGIELSIGIVSGDDLLPQVEQLKDVREMFNDSAFPAQPLSVNAYLGAFPIAAALAAGADIVITGRCVDSAVVLGPLIHEFGWRTDDYDQLAMGSLAGHAIECGAQVTGGVITDWRDTADDWDRMGFPIAVCAADGSFVITKPDGSGGVVTTQTVAEQIVYEIGDPAAYQLPDVSCDFRQVRVEQVGVDQVAVSGARGAPPSEHYKACATWQDGFRITSLMMLGGPDAVAKAQAVGRAVFKRTRRLMAERGFADYARTDTEVLGAESNWGAQARAGNTREVILKLAAQHVDRNALEIFAREVIPSGTAMAQGITGLVGGRPSPTPLVRLFSCLVPKSWLRISVDVDGRRVDPQPAPPSRPHRATVPVVAAAEHAQSSALALQPGDATKTVPLLRIAYGRSGDKGDSANIGVLARRPEFVPLLRAQLTADAVRHYFSHFVQGTVQRFELPGLHGFNFLMSEALGGGGIASLRHDPQGKLFAQVLMDFPVQVPVSLLTEAERAA